MKFIHIITSILLLIAFSWEVSKNLFECLEETGYSISLKDSSKKDDTNEVEKEDKIISIFDAIYLIKERELSRPSPNYFEGFMESLFFGPLVPPPEILS